MTPPEPLTMNPLRSMNAFRLFLLTTLVFLPALPSRAASEPKLDNNLANYFQLLRSDFNSAKVDLVNRIMKLTAADAKTFWPIYREYEAALDKLAISRAELIAEFVRSHQASSFDNTQATEMAKKWFKGQRARLDLMEKYHGKIRKALSPIQAGQFLQIENQIGIFVDLTIASEMPLVGEPTK